MRKRFPTRVGLLLIVIAMVFVAGFTWQTKASAQTVQTDAATVSAQTGDEDAMESTADHSQFEELQKEFATGPEVTAACLECHTEASKQMQQTLHWTWEKELEDGQVVGKKNVVNNYCIALETNEARCTSCHAGYGWTDTDTFDFEEETAVDCLVCHDTTGDYKKFPAGAGHPVYETKEFPPGSGKMWEPLDLSNIAQNVGQPDRDNCGSCHFSGGGGDGVKHGDLDSSLFHPDKSLDVHMDEEGLDFSCTDCHLTSGHEVSGSRYEMTAVDEEGQRMLVDDKGIATCESCHGLEPMADAKLNDHVDQIACQTCHIPEMARGGKPTKVWWDWSTAGQKNADGTAIVTKDDNGWTTYDTKKGDFIWEDNLEPVYVWYNGKSDFTVVGEEIDDSDVYVINAPQGSSEDGRIWPMKLFQGNQPYDPVNKVLAIPHLFGKDEAAYWKSYDWNTAIAAGMEDAGVPYSGEYDFTETDMYWPTTHMVAPATDALECVECHSEDGRLADIEGVNMPAASKMPVADTLGMLMLGLAVMGVVVHGGMRVAKKK